MTNMKPDLDSRAHIHDLMVAFYSQAIHDEEIGYLFTDIAHLDLDHHLPVIENFWCSILLGDRSYEGNPMQVHFRLNNMEPLTEAHFKRWIMIFCATVDQLFDGVKATRSQSKGSCHCRTDAP